MVRDLLKRKRKGPRPGPFGPRRIEERPKTKKDDLPRLREMGPFTPRPTGRPKMLERFGKKRNRPDAVRGKTTKRGKIKKAG